MRSWPLGGTDGEQVLTGDSTNEASARVGGFPHIHNDKGCRLAKVKTTPNESKEQLAQTETRQAGLAIGRAADKVDGLDLDLESMALC